LPSPKSYNKSRKTIGGIGYMLILETALIFVFYYVVPALVIIGSIIALIIIIKKKGRQVFLPYAVLPVISLLFMFSLGLNICKGGPYTKKPAAENVELMVEEKFLTEYPISEQELNDVFEVCIDYFRKSENFEYCELNQLRYLYKYSYDDCDIVMIAARYKRGYLGEVGEKNNGKFFKIERKKGSNKWVFESVNTGP
jgi:hypothetical protein